MAYLLDEEKTWVQRDFGLDRKILKGISKLGFLYPTMVQAKCLPIILQGKDVLVRARTGSGKTYAFIIPILHKIITQKEAEINPRPSIKALILAPTKELCKQIEVHTNALMYYCRDHITLCSLSDDSSSVQQYRLNAKPDIVITTPARLVNLLQTNSVNLLNVNTLIIDEADLVLSFGYSDDVQAILSKMPKIYQGLLFSATLSPELEKFKKVILHNPAVLKLHETTQSGHLLQMYLRSTELDKFLILYVFIKLGLLQGKGLIFVNDIDKCYKLKLFLQQFFISAAVLNAELPANSRTHIIEEFNRGVFDYLIATDALVDHGEEDDEDDEAEKVEGPEDEEGLDYGDDPAENEEVEDVNEDEVDENDEEEEDEEDFDVIDDDEDDEVDGADEEVEDAQGELSEDDGGEKVESNRLSSKKKSKVKSFDLFGDGYGVSRGIDFKGVAFVINFDFPTTAAAYTHRIGRTARGGATGTSLSFVTIPPVIGATSLPSQRTSATLETAERDEEVLRTVQQQQPRLGYDASAAASGSNVLAAIGSTQNYDEEVLDERCLQPSPLVFNMRELESFRYRVEDTLRAVTSAAVKELRAAEIKREILNSQQLKTYFSENPTDLKVLRHDKAVLHPIRVKEHLKHVPDYLVPVSMRSVAANRNNKKKKRRQGGQDGLTQEKKRKLSKSKDPLFASQSSPSTAPEDSPQDPEPQQTRIFTSNETPGRSTSGRQKWKEIHRKGKFSTKKKNSHRLPGSFTRAKRYK